jgi:hypothetical protein
MPDVGSRREEAVRAGDRDGPRATAGGRGRTASPRISTRLTPYTSLPRRIPWAHGVRWRERTANLLIFATLPTSLFWIWYVNTGVEHIPPEYDLLLVAAPLSALFTVIGPLAFQQGEFIYERLLRTISRPDEDGWNTASVHAKIDQLDRVYYVVVAPLTVATAVAVAYVLNDIRDIAPLPSTAAKLGAVVVLAFVGYAAGTGVWGAVKLTVVVRTIANTASFTWSPFRSQPHGLHELFRFAWSSGVLFSLGNVTVPVLIVIMPRLSVTSRLISWTFISVTFIGGFLLFALTSRWLFRAVDRQRSHALDKLAPALEHIADRIPDLPTMQVGETIRLRYALEAVMTVRDHIETSTPAPVSRRTIFAATSTLVVPVFLAVVQELASGLL